MTAAKWKAYADEHFKERAAEFLKLYPGDTDEQAARSAIDYGSDAFIAFSTWKWIEAQRKTGDAPVYRYHFELAVSGRGRCRGNRTDGAGRLEELDPAVPVGLRQGERAGRSFWP